MKLINKYNIQTEDMSQLIIELGAARWNAKLGAVDFTDADFTGANFNGANLNAADFEGANLEDADLLGAELKDANLRGAKVGDTIQKYEIKK